MRHSEIMEICKVVTERSRFDKLFGEKKLK